MFIRKMKPFLGIAIIIGAIFVLYYWETQGREVVLTKEVVMSVETISKGQEITEDMLKKQAVLKENVASGAINAGEESYLVGKVALCDISKNSQLTRSLVGNEEVPDAGLSAFALEREWIFERSSSLRQGDKIKIFNEDMSKTFGEYEIAYVRDADEHEVISLASKEGSSIWKRKDGSGVIEKVEIICGELEYKEILNYMNEYADEMTGVLHGLVLVQVCN